MNPETTKMIIKSVFDGVVPIWYPRQFPKYNGRIILPFLNKLIKFPWFDNNMIYQTAKIILNLPIKSGIKLTIVGYLNIAEMSMKTSQHILKKILKIDDISEYDLKDLARDFSKGDRLISTVKVLLKSKQPFKIDACKDIIQDKEFSIDVLLLVKDGKLDLSCTDKIEFLLTGLSKLEDMSISKNSKLFKKVKKCFKYIEETLKIDKNYKLFPMEKQLKLMAIYFNLAKYHRRNNKLFIEATRGLPRY